MKKNKKISLILSSLIFATPSLAVESDSKTSWLESDPTRVLTVILTDEYGASRLYQREPRELDYRYQTESQSQKDAYQLERRGLWESVFGSKRSCGGER